MNESEGRLKLALSAVRKVAQRPEAAELTKYGLLGAAILCTWAAASLIKEKAALIQGHPSFGL